MTFPEASISAEELALSLGIALSTVQDYCAPRCAEDVAWPHLLVGGKLRFLERHVEEIYQRHERRRDKPPAPAPANPPTAPTRRSRASAPTSVAAGSFFGDLSPLPIREKAGRV